MTTSRASFSPSHINGLSCLHQRLMDEVGMPLSLTAEQQAAMTSKSTKRFAYTNLHKEVDAEREEASQGEEIVRRGACLLVMRKSRSKD